MEDNGVGCGNNSLSSLFTLSTCVSSFPYFRYRTRSRLQLRLMEGVVSNGNNSNLFLMIFPSMSLHCKLVRRPIPRIRKCYITAMQKLKTETKKAIEGDREPANQSTDSPAQLFTAPLNFWETLFWLLISQQADQFYDTFRTSWSPLVPWQLD